MSRFLTPVAFGGGQPAPAPPSVPAAPAISGVTAGNGQLSIAFADGATGGSPITAHKVYGSTVSGFTPGPGNLLASSGVSSPALATGLANGVTLYLRLSASNGVGESAWSIEVSGTPAALTPYPSGLIFHMDSTSPTGADGSTLATWTDTASGISFTGAAGHLPTLAANPWGTGKQGVRCAAGPYMTAAANGAAAALNAAVGTQTWFTYIVGSVAGSSGYGCAFGATTGDNSYFFMADGSRIGRFNGTNSAGIPWAAAAATLISFGSSSTTDASGGSGNGLERAYVNGLPKYSVVSRAPGPAGDFSIGARADGQLPANFIFRHIFVFDHEPTPPEVIQIEKAWRDRDGLAYPWAGAPEVLYMIGDSHTAAFGADAAEFMWPARLAQARGLSYGQWANLGIGGIAVDLPSASSAGPQMQGRLSKDWNGTAAALGLSPKIIVGEWANMSGVPGVTAAGYMRTYMQGLKADSPGSKIAVWTSFAQASEGSGTTIQNRADYNASLVANKGVADVLYPVHNDTTIGTAGAVPSSNQNYQHGGQSYWSIVSYDGLHWTGFANYPTQLSGQPYFADKLQMTLSAAGY